MLEHQNDSPPVALQPMDFTDILDGTFSLYRNHFRLFMSVLAIYGIALFTTNLVSIFGVTDHISLAMVLVISIATGCATFAVTVLSFGGLIYASAQTYLRRDVTASDALRQGFLRFWPYFISNLLWFLVVAGLSVTLIGIPFALFLGTRWGLFGMPALLEGCAARAALKRSSALVKGTWWRVFGITLALLLLWVMLSFILKSTVGFVLILTGVTEAVNLQEMLRRMVIPPSPAEVGVLYYAIAAFTDSVAAILTLPILNIGSMLLYFDLRIRKEGFDIEMMVNTRESLD